MSTLNEPLFVGRKPTVTDTALEQACESGEQLREFLRRAGLHFEGPIRPFNGQLTEADLDALERDDAVALGDERAEGSDQLMQ